MQSGMTHTNGSPEFPGRFIHLLESPLSKDQIVMDLDDEYEITATVVDTEQLNWWLRGFGDAVRGVRKNWDNKKKPDNGVR